MKKLLIFGTIIIITGTAIFFTCYRNKEKNIVISEKDLIEDKIDNKNIIDNENKENENSLTSKENEKDKSSVESKKEVKETKEEVKTNNTTISEKKDESKKTEIVTKKEEEKTEPVKEIVPEEKQESKNDIPQEKPKESCGIYQSITNCKVDYDSSSVCYTAGDKLMEMYLNDWMDYNDQNPNNKLPREIQNTECYSVDTDNGVKWFLLVVCTNGSCSKNYKSLYLGK